MPDRLQPGSLVASAGMHAACDAAPGAEALLVRNQTPPLVQPVLDDDEVVEVVRLADL
jgi:hypothetical protein